MKNSFDHSNDATVIVTDRVENKKRKKTHKPAVVSELFSHPILWQIYFFVGVITENYELPKELIPFFMMV